MDDAIGTQRFMKGPVEQGRVRCSGATRNLRETHPTGRVSTEATFNFVDFLISAFFTYDYFRYITLKTSSISSSLVY